MNSLFVFLTLTTSSLLILPLISCFPTFPQHLGGFFDDTKLEAFAFDTASNLAVAGESKETGMVGASGNKFIMYSQAPSQVWNWFKQVESSIEGSLQGLAFNSQTHLAVLFQSTLLLIFDSLGTTVQSLMLGSSNLACNSPMGYPCKLKFY